MTKGDIVRVERKSIGRSFDRADLVERFGRELIGQIKEVHGDEIVVIAHCGNGKEYLFETRDLSVISSNTMDTELVKLTVGQKLLLSADSKALIRAGLVNASTSELTSKGRTVLESILFETHREAIVARANEIIAEAEA